MDSKERCCAEVLDRLCLKEFHGILVCFFNVQVVGEMGDESGEDPEFLVCGCLLLCIFERVRVEIARPHLFGGMELRHFASYCERIHRLEEVGVGALNCTDLRKLSERSIFNFEKVDEAERQMKRSR